MSGKVEIAKPYTARSALFAAWVGLCIVVGTYGSLSLPIGGYVSGFWPAMALQALGGLWFGGWGVTAASIFPLISDVIGEALPFYVALAVIPANIVQGGLTVLSFRALKADMRLKSAKDWAVWIIFGCILSNAGGAYLGSTAFVLTGLITWAAQPLFFFGWFIGNTWPAIIFGSLLLKVVTPFVQRSRLYVEAPDWW